MGQIIGIHTQTGPVSAYLAVPDQSDHAAGILLLHDVWGLNDHIKSVADRLAAQGYHVAVPNMLAGTEMERRMRPDLQEALFSPSTRERALANAQLQTAIAPLRSPHLTSTGLLRAHACFEYLYNLPRVRNRVAAIGFGYGGTIAVSLAVREPRFMGVVDFYGAINFVAFELRHIQCPVIAFAGDHDQTATPSLMRIRQQMVAAGVDFNLTLYEGAAAYFFDDNIYGAYNSGAAEASWNHAMVFLQKNMA